MKKAILFLVVICSLTANSQSLKDLLYSGKLKNDSGSVIRKSDDLTTKIDTNKKKPADAEKKQVAATTPDSAVTGISAQVDTSLAAGSGSIPPSDNNTATASKDNNRIWKEYIDSLSTTLKDEVLTNKKIKSGTYYVFVEYEIGVDGQVSINNVSPSPENSFLRDQVKERLTLTAPQMIPVLYNGKPRKSVKKYTFNLTKL